MEVHRGLDQLPSFRHAVLTIGAFDGVHHGHRTIIKRLVEKAQAAGGESVILTFDPHPRQVVFPNDKEMRLLNTLDEKINLLSETGLDHLIIAPFTVAFSQINPYSYVDDILVDKINVQHLIIGYDHKFGQNRAGNIDLLKIYEGKGAFTVEEISEQDVDDLKVSSTQIRNCLKDGQISTANKLLGKNYSLNGIVAKGSQIAGKLGYPTANCYIKEKFKLIPANGTYAARATCDGVDYVGMLYIGKSPTLQDLDDVIIEMNLFGEVKESLYDKEITIYPEKQYRGDKKFESIDELRFNIGMDKKMVEHHFLQSDSRAKVTSAILNYNGVDHLKNYLPSHEPDNNHAVTVFDNASTDDSVVALKDYKNITVISFDENAGFALGYNQAIDTIGTKYVALVNSDVRVTKDWLKPIIAILDGDESIAAVQPKILSVAAPDQFEYAGAAGGMMDSIGYPYCRGRILDTVEKDLGQYDDATEIDWASGAAMVARTSLFKSAEGLDPNFFAHMEEIDLCWRWRRAGYKIMYEPKSTVYHLGGGTISYDSPRKVYLNLRNNYWMILKNMPFGKLLCTIPFRIAIDMSYAMLFLLKGKVSHMFAAIKGIFSGCSKVFSMSQERKSISFFINRNNVGAARSASKSSTILPISYFVMNKKKYTDFL